MVGIVHIYQNHIQTHEIIWLKKLVSRVQDVVCLHVFSQKSTWFLCSSKKCFYSLRLIRRFGVVYKQVWVGIWQDLTQKSLRCSALRVSDLRLHHSPCFFLPHSTHLLCMHMCQLDGLPVCAHHWLIGSCLWCSPLHFIWNSFRSVTFAVDWN